VIPALAFVLFFRANHRRLLEVNWAFSMKVDPTPFILHVEKDLSIGPFVASLRADCCEGEWEVIES
jgi:hypothetical protein